MLRRGLGRRDTGAEGAPGGAGDQDGSAEELGNRFRVRERMMAFGDDFYVENARGERVFWIDGKPPASERRSSSRTCRATSATRSRRDRDAERPRNDDPGER